MPKMSETVNPELKDRAEKVLEKLSLSPGQALNLFYMQVLLHDGLPFLVQVPTTESIESLKKAQAAEDSTDMKNLSEIIDDKIF